jgi:hypothetical protein
MKKLETLSLFTLVFILTLYISAQAQDPCAEIGEDCRAMTAAEVKAFKERVLAAKALLPVPDPARYEHDGAAEGSTLPFIAEASFPNVVLTCRSWSAGCFPESPYNTLYFSYWKKTATGKTTEKSKDPLAATLAVQAMFEGRVELLVRLLPHPYLYEEFNDQDAVNVEQSATFRCWESGEDNINLHMVFGPRTGKEEETLMVQKPVKKFAPVKSIELLLTGPKTEIAELKKKINRQAWQALLGEVVK